MTRLSGFHLRYHLISNFYPNIQRLYIGSNSLTISDFYIITWSMKTLRLLDISYNPDVERSIGSLPFMFIAFIKSRNYIISWGR